MTTSTNDGPPASGDLPATDGALGDDDDAWPLRPADGERRGIAGVLRLFATGAAGGALTLFGLAVLAVPQRCAGATRSLSIDRERQRRCLELGITPEELAARERTEAAVARLEGGPAPEAAEAP